MEGSSLFGDAFERRLEQLGHVEIERRFGSLISRNWEVVEPLVVGLDDGSATITGFRSDDMMVVVEDHVRACMGTLRIKQVEAPPVIRIVGLSEVELEDLAVLMGAATDRAARYVPRAAAAALRNPPRLERSAPGPAHRPPLPELAVTRSGTQ